ncbi:MAG: PAS domain-containing protein, partial [candidate division Zixibacteria bacterium]|nr:PAS domain-containing protein [candidate division Zixibacteria bacterium]
MAILSLAGSLLTYLVLFKLPIRSLRRIEQALRDSEETHRRFLEAANDPIVIVDGKRGVIVHANTKAALLTGIPVGELVGQAESILYPSDETRHSMAT